jgi:hypothetical protein
MLAHLVHKDTREINKEQRKELIKYGNVELCKEEVQNFAEKERKSRGKGR